MYDILELNDKLLTELKEIARLMNIPNYDELRKQELVYKILDQQALNPSATDAIKASLTEQKPAPVPEPEKVKETRPEREPRPEKVHRHEKVAVEASSANAEK